MTVAVKGTRGGGSSSVGDGFRSLFLYGIFVFAMFSLLFIAIAIVLLTTHLSTTNHHSRPPSGGNASMHKIFLALNLDPLKTRLDLIFKQANDHITSVKAHANYFWQGTCCQ